MYKLSVLLSLFLFFSLSTLEAIPGGELNSESLADQRSKSPEEQREENARRREETEDNAGKNPPLLQENLPRANSMNNIPSNTLPTDTINSPREGDPISNRKTDFQGKPMEQLSPFHPDDNMGASWRHVPSTFESDFRDVPALRIFAQFYNRVDQINKRKEAYQEELRQEKIKNSSPQREDRIFTLEKIVSLLAKAGLYQNEIVNHLIKSESPNPRSKKSQLPYILRSSLQINEPLNKIEQIAERIQRDHLQLANYQMQLDILDKYLATLPPNEEIRPTLEQERSNIREVKEHQQKLMEHKATYAQTLQAPQEMLQSPTTLGELKRLELECRREATLRNKEILNSLDIMLSNRAIALMSYKEYALQAQQQKEKEAQQPQPRAQAIDFLTQAVDRHNEAAEACTRGDLTKAGYLNSSARALDQAAQEAQQLQPLESVIDFLTQTADRYYQAAEACTGGDLTKADWLFYSALALEQAAQEAQESQPRTQAIDFLTQTADRYYQAAEASTGGDSTKADWLFHSAWALEQATQEAQESQPRTQVIDFLTQAADQFYQAIEADAAGELQKACYLYRSASALARAGEEAQQPQPRAQAIDFLTQTANRYNEAANACTAGELKKACYLDTSASALEQAGQEAQRVEPDQLVINAHLKKAAQEYENASTMLSCTIN